LGDFLRTEIFSFVHPEGVSNSEPASKTPDNFITYISLQNFRQAIIINPFPPLNMRMFLQQVVELHLEPLFDSFFGYNKIKVEGENYHSSISTTNHDTMFYNCLPYGLFDTSIAWRRPIHTTLDDSFCIHSYLDDLIVSVKGIIDTSGFQVLDHFHITFFLDTNWQILKELQRQWFSHTISSPRLKYCEGPK
jgi:hypothetical protein